jgi:hypothetical protein
MIRGLFNRTSLSAQTAVLQRRKRFPGMKLHTWFETSKVEKLVRNRTDVKGTRDMRKSDWLTDSQNFVFQRLEGDRFSGWFHQRPEAGDPHADEQRLLVGGSARPEEKEASLSLVYRNMKNGSVFLHPSKKIGTFLTLRPFFLKSIHFLLFV